MTEDDIDQPGFEPVDNSPAPEPSAGDQPPAPEPQPEEQPAEKPAEVESEDKESEEEEETTDKRIARMAHEAREAKRQMRQMRQELEQLKGQRPPPTEDEDLDRRVNERAEQLARQKNFNDMCDKIYKAGAKEFGKEAWDGEIKELAEITGSVVPPVLVEAAYEAGDAHKILHYLSEHTDEYEALLNTPIHRMGAKVTMIANKLAAKPAKQVSKAPPPIQPLQGQSSAELDWDNMPMEQYMRERNRQEMKRRGY